MSKIKIIFALIFIGGGLFLFTHIACAGVSVSYPGSGVGDPIFNETNWVPGAKVTKTVTFTNNDPLPRLIRLNVTEKPNGKLAKKLSIEIKSGPTSYYGPGKTLKNLYSDSPIDLGEIPAGPGTSKVYDFTVEFDAEADNEYQGEKAVFDFAFYFEGEEISAAEGAGITAFPGPRGDGTLDLAIPAEFIKEKVIASTLVPAVTAVKITAKEVVPLKLPLTLPRVGAWTAFILASIGVVWEIIAPKKRRR